jgi:putative hemolysin
MGYQYYTAHTKRGAMGVCMLPNGRLVNASDFYGGKVALEWSYCAAQGYGARRDESGTICRDCLVCVLPGGEEKEVGELMGLVFREPVFPAYTLTVTKAGTGSGKITSNPPGIDCGSICFSAYEPGTPVTLTAQPDSGSTFTGWSGGGCSGMGNCVITIGDNVTVTATFVRPDTPTFGVSPPSKNFGNINIDSTIYQTFTVSNTGTVDVGITSIELTGVDAAMFGLLLKGSNRCSSLTPIIAPGGSCTFRVKFTPSTEGAKTTTLRVTASGPAGFIDVRLDGTGTLAPVFSDCHETFWAEDYINTIFYAGITAGCVSGLYCPGNNVTREQMASFLVRAVDGTNATSCSGTVFSDVPQGAPHCANIERLAALNITLGCGGGKYCPLGNVTRAEMASFIVRAVDGVNATSCTGAVFNDVPQGAPHCANIERLRTLGVTLGCETNLYCPLRDVLRDQMAAFLARAFLGMQ